MMNASHTSDGRRNVMGNGAREGRREFPSFRLVDTVSAASTVPDARAFAPLRFTLDSSRWNNGRARPQFLRPTLISPPAPEDDGSASMTQKARDAPLFPSMAEFKTPARKNSLKRPASEIPPTSFLPYKKRAITFPVSDDLKESSTRHSPEYLQQLIEKEPRMKEAASILLDMRTLATKEDEEIQSVPNSISRSSTFASVDSAESSRSSLAETPTNLPEEQPSVAGTSTTRTVTPAPSGMRLAFPEDAHELNSLHCFVRAELLEVFALPGADDEVVSSNHGNTQSRSTRRSSTNTNAGGRSCSGRVGLRCVYCAHLPRRARTGSTMSSFYPKSLSDIYRSVCTWQRIHFRTCRHIPPQVREGYWQLKESDRTRGKTRYWVSSAQRLGLVDVDSERGGICFATTPSQP